MPIWRQNRKLYSEMEAYAHSYIIDDNNIILALACIRGVLFNGPKAGVVRQVSRIAHEVYSINSPLNNPQQYAEAYTFYGL